jgi:hypothetical protein
MKINRIIFFAFALIGLSVMNEANAQYTIVATAGEHGTINPLGEIIVPVGNDQTFTFIANNNYKVDQVFVDGEMLSGSGFSAYTFVNVDANHTIHVNFVIIEDPVPPTVSTEVATNITQTEATLNGTFTTGTTTITAKGFQYKQSSESTYTQVQVNGNELIYNLTGLIRGTTYQFRTFLTSTQGGTIYEASGETLSFLTTPFNQDGTSYLIENIDDMLLLARLVNEGYSFDGQKFILMNDITLSITPNNINAIGSYPSRPFCGEFDGNTKRIYNVYIDHPNTPYQGLFGYIKNGSISNLDLVKYHGKW